MACYPVPPHLAAPLFVVVVCLILSVSIRPLFNSLVAVTRWVLFTLPKLVMRILIVFHANFMTRDFQAELANTVAAAFPVAYYMGEHRPPLPPVVE